MRIRLIQNADMNRVAGDGLHMGDGELEHCRIFARVLALQIAAADRGIKLGGPSDSVET